MNGGNRNRSRIAAAVAAMIRISIFFKIPLRYPHFQERVEVFNELKSSLLGSASAGSGLVIPERPFFVWR
jgi:hypothetical protein